MTSIGQLGENLVARWLQSQGWTILQQRWRCPGGEIDLIAHSQGTNLITFVEVKTRSRGNWDADGLLAITPQKQVKLTQSAAYFLAEYPHLADFPCRFDVALVNYKKSPDRGLDDIHQAIALHQPIQWQGYQLVLSDYLEAAFMV
ncbi:protein of unknown function UPF0102 [Rippkaea orientalis PCC 8801]|uniref:UPF0102 protein PCC8801_3870 n=1 Tax=Rippkaea orientalis (strain PCC 8801 / RF-1) TaxID=41431 RepID=B7K4B3_RIPO1|nr:YraN family protein [Rippkaea orientalis]ACK67819.1 protein of unknown function UPF0102 [Rippkaea orientalis PCC 8801]